MRYPCRCNRRACQARRTLAKHPSEYRRWPVCAVCGKGRLYVDEYRRQRGARDNAPACTDPLCQYSRITGNLQPRHRVSQFGCSGYVAYTVARNTAPRSKHCPLLDDDRVPF